MRIINQRKTLSIDEFKYALLLDGCDICAMNDYHLYVIGSYPSEQRAKEVFDEIHAAYEEIPFSGNSIYHMPQE